MTVFVNYSNVILHIQTEIYVLILKYYEFIFESYENDLLIYQIQSQKPILSEKYFTSISFLRTLLLLKQHRQHGDELKPLHDPKLIHYFHSGHKIV